MAIVTGTPIKLGACTLKLGADNYEALVSKAEFVPSTSKSTFKAINGRRVVSSGKAEWVLNIEFAQDWATPTSLSNKLFADEGTKVTAVLLPLGAGATFTVDVFLESGSVGGTADADLTATASFGCDGKPVKS